MVCVHVYECVISGGVYLIVKSLQLTACVIATEHNLGDLIANPLTQRNQL